MLRLFDLASIADPALRLFPVESVSQASNLSQFRQSESTHRYWFGPSPRQCYSVRRPRHGGVGSSAQTVLQSETVVSSCKPSPQVPSIFAKQSNLDRVLSCWGIPLLDVPPDPLALPVYTPLSKIRSATQQWDPDQQPYAPDTPQRKSQPTTPQTARQTRSTVPPSRESPQ